MSKTLGEGLEPLLRPPTTEEMELVRWLVDHGDSGSERYKGQIDFVTVIGKCNCGCPTVYFSTEGKPSTRRGEEIIRDFLAKVDGKDYGVMLFVNGGT